VSDLKQSIEHDDLIGQVFEGRFQILSVLGKGGAGVVYKAKQVHVDRLVAIKMLVAAVGSDDQSLLRFEQEAKASAALEHSSQFTTLAGVQPGMPISSWSTYAAIVSIRFSDCKGA
jgi:serine/threonine protein kinase